jgi:hypothetical protein
VYQWCGFKSRRGKNKNLTALKSISNTLWFNFQTYIYIYIYIRTKILNQLNIYIVLCYSTTKVYTKMFDHIIIRTKMFDHVICNKIFDHANL